eukprot:gene2-4357_t
MVNGAVVEPKDKKSIIKAVTAGMKKGPIKIGFRVPCTDGFYHCSSCDKFMEKENFDDAQIEAGPGKQMCCSCEEFAGMGGDWD